MTSIIRLFFPNFEPAATVESFDGQTIAVAGVHDDSELERQLVAVLDRAS
jgi:hypothetical protein